jgi:uridylate kinase
VSLLRWDPMNATASPSTNARYRRVLLKVSGGAVAGKEGMGISSEALDHIGNQILAVRDLGIEVAVVVGGGNIFRGNVAEEWGIERVEADQIGMLATVINSLFLRGVLTAKSDYDVRVMTALPMSNFAEPYIRLRATHHLEKGAIVVLACGIGQPFLTTDYTCVQRALEARADAILLAKHGVDGVYDADPRQDSSARRYESITYSDAIDADLKVMDQSAFILARDYGAPMHVFDFDSEGAMVEICKGSNVGTYIAPDAVTKLAD